ncbi:MAG TPA: TauD/TfdA family dioxygenase [Sphingobium sp.]|nr:TauD/TfdA family dioxygenase [Sphingobium sp.]
MALRIEPVTEDFAAFASGVDLGQPLDAETLGAFVAGMDRYAVMIFRDQSLTQTQQVALARQLGPPDTALDKVLRNFQTRMEYAEVSDISNVDMTGNVAPRDHRQAMMNIGNRIWHTDSSFMHYPWRYSILYAVTAVGRGGETQWADLRAAYDALDPEDKMMVEALVAEHFAGQSRALLGQTDGSEAERSIFPPVRWPLVRSHAGSGRKLLFVTSAIREIIGMSLPEGRALVAELLEHATQREFLFTHAWRPGDLAIWDNRAVIHRGKRFDMTERREMRRVATVDDVPSLPIADAERTRIYGQPCI